MFIPDKQSSIFVSGATGLLGRALLRMLKMQGYTRIKALYRSGYSRAQLDAIDPEVDWVEGDVLDFFSLENALQGVDVILHSAALISFRAADRAEMLKVNAEGTANLVNLALDLGIPRFIHVSSIAAIGRHPDAAEVDEDQFWNASNRNSAYSLSKYLAEQEVWRGMVEGLSVAIVNPTVIIGGDLPAAGGNALIGRLNKGLRFYPPGKVGIVDVADVADFIGCLLSSGIEHERYILSAATLPYRRFFEFAAEALGRPAPKLAVPGRLLRMLSRLSGLWSQWSGRAGLTPDTARAACNQSEFISVKSLSVPGFNYRPVEESIRQAAALWRKDS